MRKQVKNRVLPLLMALTMVITLLPIPGGTAEAAEAPAEFEELTATTTKTLRDGVTYYITGDLTINSGRSYKNGLVVANNATVTICIPVGMTLTVYGQHGSGTTGGGAAILLPDGATLIVVGGGKLVAQGGNAGNGAQGGQGGTSYVSDDTDGKLGYVIYQAGPGGNGGNGGGGAGAGIGTNGGSGGSGDGGGGAGWGGYNDDIRDGTRDGNRGTYGRNGSSASAAGIFICADSIDVSGVKGGSAGSGGSGGSAGADGFDGDEGDARGIGGGAGGGGGGGGYAGAAIGTGGGGGGQGGGGGSAGYIWSGRYVGAGGGGGGHGANGGGGGKRGNNGEIPEADCENTRVDEVYVGRESSDGNEYGTQGRSGSGAYMEIGSNRKVGNGGHGGSGGSAGSAATANADTGKYQTISGEDLNNWDVSLDWTEDDAGSNSQFGFTEGEQTLTFEINTMNWAAASGGSADDNSFYYILRDENGNPVLDEDGNEVRGELTFAAPVIPGLSGSQASLTLPDGLVAGRYTLEIGATNAAGEDVPMDASFPVEIKQKPLDENEVAVSFDDAEIAIDPPVFNGTGIKPAIDLAYDGKELVEGVDYDLVYSDGTNASQAINAGEASVTIRFKGNYSGEIVKTFPIEPMPLEKKDVTSTLVPVMDGNNLTFTGGIKWGDIELEPGTDYDIVITPDAQDPSKADVSIAFKGNYKNIADENGLSVPLVYEDQAVRTLLKDNMFGFAVSDIVYTGSEIKPTVTPSGAAMVEGTHYTVTYESNVGVGTGRIIITGIAESGFAGTIEKEFSIAKADQDAPDLNELTIVSETVKFKEDGSVSGVSDKMEYSADGGSTWKSITGTTLTGLAPGNYQIRYKADDNHNVGTAATVTITASSETLTVKFDLKGGTGQASEQAGFAYGAKGTVEPARPNRMGHAFLGWTLEDGTAWIFGANGNPVTDNITLYAKWVQTGFDVSGVIKDTAGNPAVGATVTAKQGNLTYEVKTTDSTGAYSFENVPAGIYNLVVEHGGKVVTALVEVAADGTVEDIILPGELVSSTIAIAPGTPNIVVGGLEEQADAVLLAAKENAGAGQNITSVTVDMSVEAKLSKDVEPDVKERIETQAASQSENLTFVDIDIAQTVYINNVRQTPEAIRETADLLTFIIPFDTAGKREFKVFRHHIKDNGEDEVHVLIAHPNSDGEFIEIRSDEIIVHAKFFSTYAIGYSEGSGSVYVPSDSVTVPTTTAGNGTVALSSKNPAVGSTVTVTVTPDEGYELEKLIITAADGTVIELTDNGDGTFSFEMPVGNVSVQAVFCIAGTRCAGGSACPLSKFSDVNPAAWYHDGVHYCIANDLMNGISDTEFAPNGTTTRAQIVTILWRLEGQPTVNYAMGFTDVAAGKWYTEAVRWAASENIVGGYSTASFGPGDSITREQFAAILWRYCQYKEIDVSVGEDTNILSYNDAFDIHSWAMSAVQWACGAGVIGGITEGSGMKLDPTGSATRAQIATMLQRFCVGCA